MENFATYRLTQTGPETQAILDQVNTNTADIAQLQAAYEALTQSEPVIIQPSDTWPVADPEENVIYRVIDRVNTPPESYSDYMWNGTAMVLMATYDNAIDPTPTAGSNNPVASDGVLNYVSTNGSAYDISAANSGTAYADLAAALGTDGANVPSSVRKGGMSVKFVQTSDNKYVRFNYLKSSTANADIANVNNWVGTTNVLNNSSNLITSNAVLNGVFFNYDEWQYTGKYINNLAVGTRIGFSSAGGWNSFKIFVPKGCLLYMKNISYGSASLYIYITDLYGAITERIEKQAGYGEYNYTYIASQDCYVFGSSSGKGFCLCKIVDESNSLRSSINEINDVKENSPLYTSTIISNFGSVAVGSVFIPSYTSLGGWNTYKISVKKGTILRIDTLRTLGSSYSSWMVFTDENNVVVSPSVELQRNTTLYNLEYTVVKDGFVYFTSHSSYASSVVTEYKISIHASAIDKYLDEISKHSRTIDEPTKPKYYISNFSSVVVGSSFIPIYGGSNDWESYTIGVKKNDKINIDKLRTLGGNFSSWVVFVDENNIVVSPSMELTPASTLKQDLNFEVTHDGYMYFCTYKDDVSTVTIVTDIQSLYRDVDILKEETEKGVDNSIEDIIVTKYLDCPLNRETDIFLDGIIRIEDDVKRRNLRITGNSSIIQIGDNQLRLTPSSASNYEANIIKYDDINMTKVHNSKQVIFRGVSRSVGDGNTIKNICISGDSLIDGTAAPCEAFRLLNEDNDFIINQIGTRNATMNGITYKHEGRGSWGWGTYINTSYGVYTDTSHATTPYAGKLNEFMIDEELNFQKYMQRNFPNEVSAGRGIDIFLMSLGTNDVTQGSSIPSNVRITEIINSAKTFINTLLSSEKGYPNCKVIIGLPGVGSKSFRGVDTYSSVFKMAILKLNKAYIDTFDNGAYNANVTCVMHGCYIDRENGYQYEDVNRNDYVGDSELDNYLSTMSADSNIPQSVKDAISYIANNYVSHRKTRRCLNQVHPLQVGYKQWGRGYYGKLRAVLDGLL